MFSIPETIADILAPFLLPSVFCFPARFGCMGKCCCSGLLLCQGKRTVNSALRVMGLEHETHFINYHRVLSRARWSSLQASKILLQMLSISYFLSRIGKAKLNRPSCNCSLIG